MRSFASFFILVASCVASHAAANTPTAAVQPLPEAPLAFSSLSFNASTTVRAPRSTMTPKEGFRRTKRSHGTIIQDPEPGDTASQPPIGGGHTTPNASQGLTPPSFPPRPSATSSTTTSDDTPPSETLTSAEGSDSSDPPAATASSSAEDNPAETSSETPSATVVHHDSQLAENRARRQKAWVSYSSKLAELSRLSAAAKTSSSEKPQWTKIRAYRDKIGGAPEINIARKHR